VLQAADHIHGLAKSAKNNADQQEHVSSGVGGAGTTARGLVQELGRAAGGWPGVATATGVAVGSFLARLSAPWSIGPHGQWEKGPDRKVPLVGNDRLGVTGHYKAQVEAHGAARLYGDKNGVHYDVGGAATATANGGLTTHRAYGPLALTDDLTAEAKAGIEGHAKYYVGRDDEGRPEYSYDIKTPNAGGEVSVVRSEKVKLGPLTLDFNRGVYGGAKVGVPFVDGVSGGYVDGHAKQHVDFAIPLAKFGPLEGGVKGGVGFDLDVPRFQDDLQQASDNARRGAETAWGWFR
jgi:hypothetical protein